MLAITNQNFLKHASESTEFRFEKVLMQNSTFNLAHTFTIQKN